jgi:Protein of unknown function (DUF2934)
VTLSHEKAARSAFSVCSTRSELLIYSAFIVPSLELRYAMKTITVATLSKTTPPEPMLEHAIRLRAYDLYAQRGMAEGHAVQDWLEAEAELLHSH